MAVLVATLLLAAFLIAPWRAALAAFSPDFCFYLACGAASNVSFPSDSPARTFVPDDAYLSHARGAQAVVATANTVVSPLYAAARASSSEFSYSFSYPASDAAHETFLVLRLHFFPFASQSQSSSSSSPVNLSSARFSVTVHDQ